ncbi:MAG: site-2 protease family protein [bacterium]|nr:site-2 protease family protein [bacterium]
MVLNIIVFLLVLGVLVFVHELGHFMAAKALGIGVQEFGIGFPPRLFSKTRRGTVYSLNWLPFGGFVKLKGMDTVSNDHDSYQQARVWKRLLTVAAGVIMNVVLAFVILFVAYLIGFSPATQPLETYKGAKILHQEVVILGIQTNSAAAAVGLQPGDIIKSGNQQPLLTLAAFQQFTQAQAGQQIDLTVKRGSAELTLQPTLPSGSTAPLGVSIASNSVVRLPFLGALKGAWLETWGILKAISLMLVDLVKEVFTQHQVPAEVVGPVGIYRATAAAVSVGWSALVSLVVILSLNLALVNVLPIPALDGGYILFLLAELIFRKKIIKEKIEGALVTLGFILLITLLILMTWRDLVLV